MRAVAPVRTLRSLGSSTLVFLLVAVTALGFVPAHRSDPPVGMKPAAASADSTCWDYRPSERAFAERINLARSVVGKGRLNLDPELSKSARRHTYEMTSRATLYHTPTNVLMRRVTNWSTLGENVGVGGEVQSLHSAFMASPAHRDNILYPTFRYVGIGVRESDGRMWVTVLFEAAGNPGTRLRMPSCS